MSKKPSRQGSYASQNPLYEDNVMEDDQNVIERFGARPIKEISAHGTRTDGHNNRWQVVIDIDNGDWVTVEMLNLRKEPVPKYGTIKIAAENEEARASPRGDSGEFMIKIPADFSGEQLARFIHFVITGSLQYQFPGSAGSETWHWLYATAGRLERQVYGSSRTTEEYGKTARILLGYIKRLLHSAQNQDSEELDGF